MGSPVLIITITKKKIGNGQGLTLYSKSMDRVRVFKYLGVWIDEK